MSKRGRPPKVIPFRRPGGAAKKSMIPKSVTGNSCGALEGLEITAVQGANIVMISNATVTELERGGWVKRTETGLFNAIAFVRGWLAYQKDLVGRKHTLKSGASRIQTARAVEIELRTARDAGELIEMSEAIALAQMIAGETRSVFGALPARISRDLELRARIEQAVNEGFNTLADKLETGIAALDCGDGVDLSSAEDDDAPG